MTRRTRCLTYGQTKRSTAATGTINGAPFHLCVVEYVTLCGREDEDPMDPPGTGLIKRPVGICRGCWAVWRRDVLRLGRTSR